MDRPIKFTDDQLREVLRAGKRVVTQTNARADS
jgi:hypothetical protein